MDVEPTLALGRSLLQFCRERRSLIGTLRPQPIARPLIERLGESVRRGSRRSLNGSIRASVSSVQLLLFTTKVSGTHASRC